MIPKKFKKYYTEISDVREFGGDVYIFEFPKDETKLVQEFLEDVGGEMHPRGGNRICLSVEPKSPKFC